MNDWDEIYNFNHIRKGLKVQTARCMDCGVPFCQSSYGCPLGNLIPKWNDLVYQNKWKDALDQLLQTNNFPEFTGRVCPAPCESACVLGINSSPVTIKSIECAIIDHAFEQGWMKPEPPSFRSGKKVAVVGSGPAGLACAHQLNKAGHLVTVYERDDAIGGLLQYGIPTMKLSRSVVQRRIDLMEKEGIIFQTGVNIGKDISAKELHNNFDSVVLCLGATKPRDISIPGRELDGIYQAVAFLETWQKKQSTPNNKLGNPAFTAKDRDVIVLGGGDTGCDCIGTSLRQGARSITTFEILPPPPTSRAADNPWPQWGRVFKVDYGHEEVKTKFGKDPRLFNMMSKEFVDDGHGRVAGIKAVQVEWTKDPAGRWIMSEIAGSEKLFKCDMVLLAMGFLGPERYIIDQLKLDEDPRSNVATSNGQYSTNVARVFAAGDCRRGQSLVVWAIAEGRQAARQTPEISLSKHIMAYVYLESFPSSVWLQLEKQTSLSHDYLVDELSKHLGIARQNVQCKFSCGYSQILPGSCNPWPQSDTFVRTSISLAGGKGGFGSMLRAIGAQIEKTTNREACRDLSGRRLRDINEEKRLKDWVSKQADREKEREERKQKKLEKLRQEYHHEFHDPEYFRVRSEVLDTVNEALEQGIQASSSTAVEPPLKKHKASDDGRVMRKTAFWIGVSDDESDSSEDERKSVLNTSCKTDERESESPESSSKMSDELQTESIETSDETESSNTKKEDNIPLAIPTKSVVDTPPPHEQGAEETVVPSTPVVAEEIAVPTPATTEPTVFLPIDLQDFDSSKALESLGLNHLKHELQRLGLKCGGSLSERALRLYSIKGLSVEEIDPSLLAKPPKKK
uniref:EOG090X0OE5 n=1 Tax=Daphnia similis TaxID=35528 RepID=A0A4Y7LWH9_9CRUS|nr:EOG090X0OE5 [Daphnia similis]SVE72746.1 EOG090X0OE5 [Daphnia similis]